MEMANEAEEGWQLAEKKGRRSRSARRPPSHQSGDAHDAKKNLEAEEIDQEQTEVYTGKSVPYRPFDESQTNDSSYNEEENRVE
jgi:hypothetical protein